MVTYLYILHCMDFSVNSQWWGEGEMMRPSVQGVDPPVCCTPGCYCYICKRQLCGFPQCAASWMTYARDSFVDSQGGLLSSRGGGPDTLAQTHWHQSYSWIKSLFLFSLHTKGILKASYNYGWTTDVTRTNLTISLLPFWALNVIVALLSMQGQNAFGFHQNFLNFVFQKILCVWNNMRVSN